MNPEQHPAHQCSLILTEAAFPASLREIPSPQTVFGACWARHPLRQSPPCIPRCQADRQLDFTDAGSLANSFGEGSLPGLVHRSDRGGVTTETVEAETRYQTVPANMATWYKDVPLVIEFVGDQVPVTLVIELGETVQITVPTHAAFPDG